MPWISETEYRYTSGILKSIAQGYWNLYSDGFSMKPWKPGIINTWQIAEYRADFDVALNAIGRGHWEGDIETRQFRDYKGLGRLQRMIVADVYKISDIELEKLGFHQIPQMRGRAYHWMANYLNGLPLWGFYKGRNQY